MAAYRRWHHPGRDAGKVMRERKVQDASCACAHPTIARKVKRLDSQANTICEATFAIFRSLNSTDLWVPGYIEAHHTDRRLSSRAWRTKSRHRSCLLQLSSDVAQGRATHVSYRAVQGYRAKPPIRSNAQPGAPADRPKAALLGTLASLGGH